MPRIRQDHESVVLEGLDRPENGVSVVVASYRSHDSALVTLQSLASQTLDPSRFEIVLVVNGPHANDVSKHQHFAASQSELSVRIVRSPLAGVSHALNLGIQAARMNWVTFVDDDDAVSPRYLEGLLSVAGPGLVPITLIDDVHRDGTVTSDNRINDQIRPLSGRVVGPEECPRGLGFTTAKLLPTDWARAARFKTHLRNGQDVTFFTDIYARYDFSFAVVPHELGSIYYRTLSESSLSRRDLSFSFAIDDRLDVMESLDERLARTRTPKQPLIRSLMRAQAMFMRRYLDSHPEDRPRVNTSIRTRAIDAFPWNELTRGAAKTLVTSVCFPPYSDASSVTIAKRIADSGSVVDVVTADMSDVRSLDPSLDHLVAGLVGVRHTVNSRVAFSDWNTARQYCLEGWRLVERHVGRRWPYERLYSRAMWPASHVLAALVKIRHPETRWTAEFSDPLSRTVEGATRFGPYESDDLTEELLSGATQSIGAQLPPPTTLFELAEILPYALADDIMFTNERQLDYMLSYCMSPELVEIVRSKAIISPHPIPSSEYYHLVDSDGVTASDRVTLAYFGNFYANRSLSDLFIAIDELSLKQRRQLAFDIYTSDKDTLYRRISELNLFDVVSIKSPVPYLAFLNLTTKYDCLVVNDTSTAGTHSTNPYLPSKWSDYRGSGKPIWALVEPGSTLAGMAAEYSSELGNVAEASRVLQTLVHRRRQADDRSVRHTEMDLQRV